MVQRYYFYQKKEQSIDDFLRNLLVYSHSGSIYVLGSLFLVLAYLIDEEVLSANALVGLYRKFFIPPFPHTFWTALPRISSPSSLRGRHRPREVVIYHVLAVTIVALQATAYCSLPCHVDVRLQDAEVIESTLFLRNNQEKTTLFQ